MTTWPAIHVPLRLHPHIYAVSVSSTLASVTVSARSPPSIPLASPPRPATGKSSVTSSTCWTCSSAPLLSSTTPSPLLSCATASCWESASACLGFLTGPESSVSAGSRLLLDGLTVVAETELDALNTLPAFLATRGFGTEADVVDAVPDDSSVAVSTVFCFALPFAMVRDGDEVILQDCTGNCGLTEEVYWSAMVFARPHRCLSARLCTNVLTGNRLSVVDDDLTRRLRLVLGLTVSYHPAAHLVLGRHALTHQNHLLTRCGSRSSPLSAGSLLVRPRRLLLPPATLTLATLALAARPSLILPCRQSSRDIGVGERRQVGSDARVTTPCMIGGELEIIPHHADMSARACV